MVGVNINSNYKFKGYTIKKLIYIILIIPFLYGHAPWGAHQVYRQLHMLIMCSKKDPGAYDFSKKLEKAFDIYLPEAKAKIARAPHSKRIFNMMLSDQIPLALLSYDLLDKLIEDSNENVSFFKDKTKMIFSFSDMVLIANQNFPSEKSIKIYNSLIQLSKESKDKSFTISNKKNFLISFDKQIKLSLEK